MVSNRGSMDLHPCRGSILPWNPARSCMAPSVVLLLLVMSVLTQPNPLYQVEHWSPVPRGRAVQRVPIWVLEPSNWSAGSSSVSRANHRPKGHSYISAHAGQAILTDLTDYPFSDNRMHFSPAWLGRGGGFWIDSQKFLAHRSLCGRLWASGVFRNFPRRDFGLLRPQFPTGLSCTTLTALPTSSRRIRRWRCWR